MPSASEDELRGREPRVLELTLQGKEAGQIAQQIGVSARRIRQIKKLDRFRKAFSAAIEGKSREIAAKVTRETSDAIGRIVERGAGTRQFSEETKDANAADTFLAKTWLKLEELRIKQEIEAGRRGTAESAADAADKVIQAVQDAVGRVPVPPAPPPPSDSDAPKEGPET